MANFLAKLSISHIMQRIIAGSMLAYITAKELK